VVGAGMVTSAYKDLRNHHLVPAIRKQLNRLKNHQLSLDSRGEDTGKTATPKTRETDRRIQRVKWKVLRSQSQGGKTCTITDKELEPQAGQVLELKTPGAK
jgi:hypothetical protein